MASSVIRLRWPEPAAFESVEALDRALAERSERLERLIEEESAKAAAGPGGDTEAGVSDSSRRLWAGSDLPRRALGDAALGAPEAADAPHEKRPARVRTPRGRRSPPRTHAYETVAGGSSRRVQGVRRAVEEVVRENGDLVASMGVDVGFAVPPPEVALASAGAGEAEALNPILGLGLDPDRDRSGAGAGVRVAVIDSGLDPAHPEFRNASILTGYSYDYWRLHGVRRGVVTSIAVPPGGAYATRHYHGTAVAGLVAGGRSGVAPAASLIIHNVFYLSEEEARRLRWQDDQGRWQEPDTTILRVEPALMYSLAAQADILVLSFGTPGYDPCFEDEAEYLRNCGRLVVAAAGNAGPGHNMSPGDYDGILSVGATGADGTLWPRTSAGRVEHGGRSYVKPDLYAPGEGLRVPVPAAVAASGYLRASGTSFAAPLVAGVAAAVLGRLREKGERPKAAAVKDVLLATADEIELPEELGGRGRRLNARRALEAAG